MLWIALQPGLEPAGGSFTLKSGPPDASASSGANADLQALAWHALAYTPRVTQLEEAVLMEVSASVRLFGGLQALLQRLVREHAQARAAASVPVAAQAAAQSAAQAAAQSVAQAAAQSAAQAAAQAAAQSVAQAAAQVRAQPSAQARESRKASVAGRGVQAGNVVQPVATKGGAPAQRLAALALPGAAPLARVSSEHMRYASSGEASLHATSLHVPAAHVPLVSPSPALPALPAQPALRGAPGHTALAALARLRTGLPWRESSRLAVGDLPLFALSPAQPYAAVLERLGCRTWDDLRQLPREGLARRFGQPLLQALDQAFGEQPESHDWLTLPEVFDESLELPALVEHASALMFGVDRLLARLRLWLLARGLGLLGLRVRWLLDPRRDVARSGEFTLRLGEASQDMTHVARLLAEHLAKQELPAPAHTLSLCTLETAPLTSRSHSLLMEDRQPGDSLAQLVERLSARLGPERVLHWQAQARHVPERMQRWVPAQVNAHAAASPVRSGASVAPNAPAGPAFQFGKRCKPIQTDQATPAANRFADRSADSAAPGQPPAMLPSWLLDEPLPLILQGERPCYEGPLTLLVGPQRLETTGWAARSGALALAAVEAPVMRDYFIARSPQAGLLWIFRQRPGNVDDGPAGWFLHGIFA